MSSTGSIVEFCRRNSLKTSNFQHILLHLDCVGGIHYTRVVKNINVVIGSRAADRIVPLQSYAADVLEQLVCDDRAEGKLMHRSNNQRL